MAAQAPSQSAEAARGRLRGAVALRKAVNTKEEEPLVKLGATLAQEQMGVSRPYPHLGWKRTGGETRRLWRSEPRQPGAKGRWWFDTAVVFVCYRIPSLNMVSSIAGGYS